MLYGDTRSFLSLIFILLFYSYHFSGLINDLQYDPHWLENLLFCFPRLSNDVLGTTSPTLVLFQYSQAKILVDLYNLLKFNIFLTKILQHILQRDHIDYRSVLGCAP